MVAVATAALAHEPGRDARLAKIGPAPGFTLATHEGGTLSLEDLRGKVVVVTFIYATCADTCPLLTAKLAGLRQRLGRDLGTNVVFAAITVDPERDTTSILKSYAVAHGVNIHGWVFLRGTASQIQDVASRYGVVARRSERGDVDHTFLTSLVDRDGTLRVQYMGVRFDAKEMLGDLRSLLAERRSAPR